MPAFLKTPADERHWKLARQRVEEEYHLTEDDGKRYWRLVTGLWKRMKKSLPRLILRKSQLGLGSLTKARGQHFKGQPGYQLLPVMPSGKKRWTRTEHGEKEHEELHRMYVLDNDPTRKAWDAIELEQGGLNVKWLSQPSIEDAHRISEACRGDKGLSDVMDMTPGGRRILTGDIPSDATYVSFILRSAVEEGLTEPEYRDSVERLCGLFVQGSPQIVRTNAGDSAASGWKENVVNSMHSELKQQGFDVDYEWCNDLIRQWADTSNDSSIKSFFIQKVAAETFGRKLSKWQQERWQKLTGGKDASFLGELESDIVKQNALVIKLHRKLLDLLCDIDNNAEKWSKEKFNAVSAAADAANNECRLESNKMVRMEENVRGFRELAEHTKHKPAIVAALKFMHSRSQEVLKNKFGDSILLYRGVKAKGLRNILVGERAVWDGNALESWSISLTVARDFGNASIAMRVPIDRIVSMPFTGLGCLNEKEVVIKGGRDIVEVV